MTKYTQRDALIEALQSPEMELIIAVIIARRSEETFEKISQEVVQAIVERLR